MEEMRLVKPEAQAPREGRATEAEEGVVPLIKNIKGEARAIPGWAHLGVCLGITRYEVAMGGRRQSSLMEALFS
jgi:hypothetical protein